MFALEWISGLPWPLVLITFLVPCLVIVALASAATRNFDPKDRTNDNLARAALALLGGALIFTGAFTIITSWTEADQLRASAQREAILGQGIVRTVEVVAPTDSSVALAMATYAESVIQNETGLGGKLEPSQKAEDAFVSLALTTVGVVKGTGVGTLESQAVMDSISNLQQAREQRVGELSSSVFLPIIGLLVVMAVINLVGIGLFPSGTSHRLKWVYCSVVAVAISAILTTIVVLQSVPFIRPELTEPFGSLLSYATSR